MFFWAGYPLMAGPFFFLQLVRVDAAVRGGGTLHDETG